MKTHHLLRCLTATIALAGLCLSGCQKKTAEERGKDAADEKAAYVKGVGDSLQGKGKEAAESIGGGLVKVWNGLNEGIEGKSASAVRMSPDLEKLGLKVTRAQLSPSGTVSVYIINRDALKKELRLCVFDKEGLEVGRACAVVDSPVDGANYVDFAFDKRVPMALVTALELGIRQGVETGKTQ